MPPPVKRRDGSVVIGPNTTVNPPELGDRTIKSDVTVQHVAGSVDYAYFQSDRALSMSADDVERHFGLSAYEKMFAIEGTSAGILATTKILTLGKGIRVGTSHKKPPRFGATLRQKDDWDQAQIYQEYIQEVIARLEMLDESILLTMGDQLNATFRGHTLCEKELGFFPSGKFRDMYCLESLRVKPRENYDFIVDPMNRTRGVIARIPGVSMMTWQGLIKDPSVLVNAISMEKFITLTCDKRYGDPRGVSMARAIWDAYTRLQKHIKPDMVKTGHAFGGGIITVVGPENARDVNVVDPDTGEFVNILVAIKRQAVKMASGGVGVFPSGTTVKVEYPQADPAFFESQVRDCKQEMYQRWFGSAEAFLPAETNSEANANTSQDTVDAATRYFQQWLSLTYRRGLCIPLIRRSFGEDQAVYAPPIILNPEGKTDWAVNMNALAAYAKSPAWDDSQAIGFDEEFDNPERDPDWEAKKAEKAAQVQADQPVPGEAA